MTRIRGLAGGLLIVFAGACAKRSDPAKPVSAPAPFDSSSPIVFGESRPEAEGMDSRPLLDLAKLIRDHETSPIFSVLVSRNGKVVFELYTSSTTRDDAHYMMSVTKSFTSALMGIAIEKHLVRGADESIAEALPKELFASEADRARFQPLTVKDVLGMSGLDASVPPHDKSPEAAARQKGFLGADNRVRFALTQPLLPELGVSFLYTDMTPILAIGMIEYASHETALRFAEENLFGPLEFKNYEWMHEDPSGMDNGAYGLRIRPIDMQKFGVLYLAHGVWNGKPVLPASWVDTSFTPWIRSKPDKREPNYGWFWWTLHYGKSWTARAALGWKGQSIIVVPEQNLVVTMTGYVDGGGEDELRDRIVEDFIIPSVEHGKDKKLSADPAVTEELARVLAETQKGPLRVGANAESRMTPSAQPKEKHREIVR